LCERRGKSRTGLNSPARNAQTTFISITLNGHRRYINRTFNTCSVSASELNTAV
jgi:hypothetical protein